ncbi:uroporphyrinogen-III synthase [Nonlabens sp. Asnod3-A02]|uniref:uroporphyrinogen-III synthase n=1 Tax=Nonlabens sp. Asnod3-A02 TaxID=3160579 RepID=UPI003866B95D
MKNSLLSTKTLTPAQQELVLNTGIGLTHYNILRTKPIVIKDDINWDHIIITSKNAIPALLPYLNQIKNIYCVGNQTAALLQEKGLHPNYTAQNAADLAVELTSTYSGENFYYLCSEQRRDELPAFFLDKKIPLKEVFVYSSIAVMKSFDRIFAAIAFYSPRGVHAFAKANPNNKPLIAVCIGETTASTARLYYKNIAVANKQTIENTLITAIKALRND